MNKLTYLNNGIKVTREHFNDDDIIRLNSLSHIDSIEVSNLELGFERLKTIKYTLVDSQGVTLSHGTYKGEYVTHRINAINPDNKYWGHYFNNYADALEDYYKRVKGLHK